ncbi:MULTISPECIES: L-threonylcarbamoyladenylate synthase [unclassified Phycicoccus]|uniref:L-threonylcarbamoyladenylate synthase n=1 Tax=unclassified Phycicoccus TaxID=2637926 RepID=UPI0007025EC0|nr:MULTISPECIES: L-threonylcarbamoyladenylate synthase [unclassified Phycicoccus]KRF25631.1 threonylcarbamoyl-AMP synthase [Phycicoccus sp. Soil803]KRF27755.1 threonylcarbamoyl-AMP synthase [Phycicoccus sp. Soil802]
MSPVYDCSTDEGRREGVAKAVEAVRAGEIVVLPTDTVYGVGADAFSAEAVASLLAAKGRGREMPPPVLVPSVRTVDGLATDVPAWARDLIREFWPGPLTLVFKAQTSLMWDLGETNGTVALRMPQDDIALAVLSEVGPMAVTSANLTGQPAATTATDAASQLGSAVSVYLDGGPTTSTEVSTIVDCTGEEFVVLRAGAVTEEQLRAALEPKEPERPAEPDQPEQPGEAETTDEATTLPGEASGTPETDGTQAIELPADPATDRNDGTDSTLPGDPHER